MKQLSNFIQRIGFVSLLFGVSACSEAEPNKGADTPPARDVAVEQSSGHSEVAELTANA